MCYKLGLLVLAEPDKLVLPLFTCQLPKHVKHSMKPSTKLNTFNLSAVEGNPFVFVSVCACLVEVLVLFYVGSIIVCGRRQ